MRATRTTQGLRMRRATRGGARICSTGARAAARSSDARIRRSQCSLSSPVLLPSSLQVVFIVSSCAIVYMMKFQRPINETYDAKADSFNIWFLIGPCAVLALLINDVFWATEVPRPGGKTHPHHYSAWRMCTEVSSRHLAQRGARTLQLQQAAPRGLLPVRSILCASLSRLLPRPL